MSININKLRKEIRQDQVTVWKGKREHTKNLIVIVDSSNGTIKEYTLTSEHRHDGLKDGSCTAEEIYGCNGFERARLIEGSITKHEAEN